MSDWPCIWCVGGAHLDWIGRAAGPLSGAGSTPGAVRAGLGGVALNVASALAQAGRRAALIGARGRDAAGDALAAGLAARGVLDRLIAGAAPTGAYLAIEDQAGALAAAIADAAALQALPAADLAAALAQRPAGDPLFLDANLTGDQIALALAGAPGFRAADAVSAVKAPRLGPHLAQLDALFCNRAEAEALLGRPTAGAADAAAALAAFGPRHALVTDGPRPAAIAEAELVFEATPRKIAAGGETGAGDAFIAAALDRITQGAPADAALKAGLAAGAKILEAAP